MFQLNSETKSFDCFDWNLCSIEIAIVLIPATTGCPLELYILLPAIIASILSETGERLIYCDQIDAFSGSTVVFALGDVTSTI